MKKRVVYVVIFLVSISLAIAVDKDGDGCDTQPALGTGVSFDCDDNNPSICAYADKDLFFDMDNDGHYATSPTARHLNDDYCKNYNFQFSPGNDGGGPAPGCDMDPLHYGVNCEYTKSTPTTPQTPACTVYIWIIDQDGDGFCGGEIESCTSPGAGYFQTAYGDCSWDCNDGDKNIVGKKKWYLDKDGDEYYPLGGIAAPSCSSPGQGWTTTVKNMGDCEDRKEGPDGIEGTADDGVNWNPGNMIDNPNNGIDEDCKDGDLVVESSGLNNFKNDLDANPELKSYSDLSQTEQELQKFADKYEYENVESILFNLDLLLQYPDLKDKMKHGKELAELGYSIYGAGFFLPTNTAAGDMFDKFKEAIYPFGGGSDEISFYGSYHITEFLYLKGRYIYKTEQILGSDADWIEQVYALPTGNTPISGGAVGLTYECNPEELAVKGFNYVKTGFKKMINSIANNN
ncbi:MAG: hypothetical protein ABIJ08_03320 [Nanoarchaeota archaeon]